MAECFIGRQPIFNHELELHAYELLYSAPPGAAAQGVHEDVATSELIMSAFVEIGLENVVADQLAYITLSRGFLINPDLVAFPPEQVVVQLAPTLSVDEELLDAVQHLKDAGYTLALDDFVFQRPLVPLIPHMDVVKFDVRNIDMTELGKFARILGTRNVQMVAKGLPDKKQLASYRDIGIDFFQGNFLSKPNVVVGRRIPHNKMAVLQLLSKLSDNNTSFADLEELVRMDVSLSHKALHFVNSPLSGLMVKVDSVRQALSLLGRDLIKNWVMLLTIANIDDSIPELVTTVLVRAHLCESLAKAARLPEPDSFFTVGLFSALDAMMDQPMESVLESMPFTDEMKSAISDLDGERGEALSCALQLEMGDIESMRFQQLEWQQIADIYLDSLRWADESIAQFANA